MVLSAAAIIGVGLLLYFVVANIIDGAIFRAAAGSAGPFDDIPGTRPAALNAIRRRALLLNVVRPAILTAIIFGGGALTIALLGLPILGAVLAGAWFFFLTQHACLIGRTGPSLNQAVWAMVTTVGVIIATYAAGHWSAEPSQKRKQAFNTLVSSYGAYRGGRETEGRAGVERALALDPELAYGNIVRGEIALKEQDWPLAQKHFERGLALLKQPDQPVSPGQSAKKISTPDVEADARCLLGFVYIKRAQEATRSGRDQEEQRYLELANRSLRAGLALNPGKETRELAERLLQMFR